MICGLPTPSGTRVIEFEESVQMLSERLRNGGDREQHYIKATHVGLNQSFRKTLNMGIRRKAMCVLRDESVQS